jgi:hypothetical protein
VLSSSGLGEAPLGGLGELDAPGLLGVPPTGPLEAPEGDAGEPEDAGDGEGLGDDGELGLPAVELVDELLGLAPLLDPEAGDPLLAPLEEELVDELELVDDGDVPPPAAPPVCPPLVLAVLPCFMSKPSWAISMHSTLISLSSAFRCGPSQRQIQPFVKSQRTTTCPSCLQSWIEPFLRSIFWPSIVCFIHWKKLSLVVIPRRSTMFDQRVGPTSL